MTDEAPRSASATAVFPFRDFAVLDQLFSRLRTGNRFFLDDELTRAVADLNDYAKRCRAKEIRKGEVFSRARIHEEGLGGVREPFPPEELGAPPLERATGGRLNPEGIRYLYLASDDETAVAEMRPWRGADITLAKIRITRDTRVVNLADKTASGDGAAFTWTQVIGRMFSLPHGPVGTVPADAVPRGELQGRRVRWRRLRERAETRRTQSRALRP